MATIVARDLELAYGDHTVLMGCSLRVEPGDRIGLVGPNGCGKSTLLGLLAKRSVPDHGEVRHTGTVSLLDQQPIFDGDTVGEVVDNATAWHGVLRDDWQRALDEGDLDRAAELQARLDEVGWAVEHKADALLTQLDAPAREASIHRLSGGERRRVALAACLLSKADVLLLDEPTNHLDAATINWLEKFLVGYRGAVVLITHDRYLLETVAEQIIEVEHGKLVGYEGSYGDYLITRAERVARLQTRADRRLQLLARETAWAARSPAARSTKQRARLQRLDALRENGVKVPIDRSFELDFSTGFRKGGTVLEGYGLGMKLGDRWLIRDLDLAIRPGDRIGIVGPNGAGKSTLLRMLEGRLEPTTGRIHRGARVKIGLLDQERTGLDPDDTLVEAAGGGNDRVQLGDRWVHVITFLERLLFRREQLEAKVAGLSGGERARILLAKRMLEGSNVLLLDEPTNDLDLWTLRVLEEALLAFDGATIVVTHDRAFLDRVCTAVLAFEGDGRVVRYADRLQADRAVAAAAPPPPEKKPAPAAPSKPKPQRDRLSFKEKKELEALPEAIEALENEQQEVEGTLADPATYRDRAAEVPTLTSRLDALPAAIEALYGRWEELSERAD